MDSRSASTAGPELVGIGAVNLDHILFGDRAKRSAEPGFDPVADLGFDHGSERAATAERIDETLAALRSLNPVTSPGGSALNTMATVAGAGIPLSVGYVGVRGTTTTGFSFHRWFAELGIDDQFVGDVDEPSGTCLSYTSQGRRSLLTTDGANRWIMDHIADRGQALVDYCCGAELLLVTSFANQSEITPIVDLLREVRRRAPDVLIATDPGAMWSRQPRPDGVDQLLGLSDWLLLNGEEFDTCTDRSPGEDPAAAAGPLLERSEAAAPAVLLKGPERVMLFSGSGPVETVTVENDPVLSADQIVDDTGAGDAFAAGFLSSLVLPSMVPVDGVRLGQRLATEKLRWVGLSGIEHYPAVHRRFLAEREPQVDS